MQQASPKKAKREIEEVQDCPVCMDRKVNCFTTECQHHFCYRCLSKWGRKKGKCPLCRTKVRKIHYKKKIIEPDYLKFFDMANFSDSSEPPPQRRERPRERPEPRRIQSPPLRSPNIVFFIPYFPNYFPISFPFPVQNYISQGPTQ